MFKNIHTVSKDVAKIYNEETIYPGWVAYVGTFIILSIGTILRIYKFKLNK